MTPGPKRENAGSSIRRIPKIAGWPSPYINVRRCGALSMVHLQLKDPKEKGISSQFRCSISVERDVKTPNLPSFYTIDERIDVDVNSL